MEKMVEISIYFFVNTSCLERLVYNKQCFENPKTKPRHGNFYNAGMEEGGYVLLDEVFWSLKIMTETIVMWENLACVGEINYRSASLEGAANITTPSAFNSYIMLHHGLINYEDAKTKCRLFYWCLIEFVDWRGSQSIQSCWYFRPSSVNYCPNNLLSFSPPPPLLPSHTKSKYGIYRQCLARRMWGGGGWVLNCVGDHILKEFSTLFITRFRTYKIALTSPTKT